MIKKYLMLVFVFLLISSFIAVDVSSQEKRMNFKEIEDKAGMVPGDTFYFLDRAFDVFKSSEKLANERAYELAVLANKSVEGEVDSERIEKAREGYENVMNKAQKRTQNKEDASERVANATTRHLEALSMVYEKVPEEAKGAIENAMNRSMKGREDALNALGNFNESKSQQMREQINQRIQEGTGMEMGSEVEIGSGAGQEKGPGAGEQNTGQGEDSVEESGEAYEKFKNSLEENPEYHVEYEFTSSEGKIDVVDIHTKDGKTRVNVDGSDEYSFWMNGESVVEYEGQCIDLEAVKDYGVDPMSIYDKSSVSKGSIKSEDEYLEVSSAGTKEIAGKTTECFEFVYETSEYNQLTTYCLTDEGIPALMKTVNKDSGELQLESRATKLEDSVSDSVLEACEPNTEIPDF